MTIRHVEPLGKVRTKIVATVGPASRDPGCSGRWSRRGSTSFGSTSRTGRTTSTPRRSGPIRAVGEEVGRDLAVLQDLGGPKIRLGPIPGDSVECHLGDEFVLVAEPDLG